MGTGSCMMNSSGKIVLEQDVVGLTITSTMSYTVRQLLGGCLNAISKSPLPQANIQIGQGISLETTQERTEISPFVLQGSPVTGCGEPVGPLMGGKISQAAVMTTSVASVRDPIQPLDARNPILSPNSVSPGTINQLLISQIFNKNLPTPVNPSKLQEYLHFAKYPEHLTKKLVAGFESGFSLGYMGSMDIALRAKNLKSCNVAEETVEVKLAKEIAKGHISEGYDTHPLIPISFVLP